MTKALEKYRLVWLGMLIGLLPLLLNAATGYDRKFRVDGEYGLWVEKIDDEVVVHWMTMDADSGFLRVYDNAGSSSFFKTPADYAHMAAFHVDGNRDITIEYGSLEYPEYAEQTVLYLSEIDTPQPSVFTGADSVFVVGDIHGKYNNLVSILQQGGVIDASLDWMAGRGHLVIMGDVFDRGHDVIKSLWFLYRLERRARESGGELSLLLGNHEIMIFTGDTRYVTNKELLIARYHQVDYAEMFDIQHSVLGNWLAQQLGLLKIDDLLFAHGGIVFPYAKINVEAFNKIMYTYLNEENFAANIKRAMQIRHRCFSSVLPDMFRFFFDPRSVFWYRDFVCSDDVQADLDLVLDRYQVRHLIVGHSRVSQIQTFYDNKVIAVDMLDSASEMLIAIRTPMKSNTFYRLTLDGKKQKLFEDNQSIIEPTTTSLSY
jgi:hypothetical protein